MKREPNISQVSSINRLKRFEIFLLPRKFNRYKRARNVIITVRDGVNYVVINYSGAIFNNFGVKDHHYLMLITSFVEFCRFFEIEMAIKTLRFAAFGRYVPLL